MAENPQVRSVLWQIAGLTLAVAVTKVVLGSRFHSAAMTATGLSSVSTGAVTLALLVSAPAWRRTAAALLFLISLGLTAMAVQQIGRPPMPAVSVLTFSLMLFTVAASLGIYLYEVRTARRWRSPLLNSDAARMRTDVLTSCVVLGGLVGIWLGSALIDGLLALLIAVRIAQSAWRLLRTPPLPI